MNTDGDSEAQGPQCKVQSVDLMRPEEVARAKGGVPISGAIHRGAECRSGIFRSVAARDRIGQVTEGQCLVWTLLPGHFKGHGTIVVTPLVNMM